MFKERRSLQDRPVWIAARSPQENKKKSSLCSKSMSPHPVCTSNQALQEESLDISSEPKDIIAFNNPENKSQSKQESEIAPSTIKVKTEEPELDLGINVLESDRENEFNRPRISPDPDKLEEKAVKKEDLGPRLFTNPGSDYIQVGT